jgi:micrococcal nuclease
MLLIDTPEDVDPDKPVEPFAYDAANYAKSVLPVGKHVYLEEGKKGSERDKYNRLLAYVYITPTDMYNIDVVKKGLAMVAYIYPPNTDHLSNLQIAQSYAKSQNLGIWIISGYVSSDGYSLTKSCDYAKRNGYSTRGCETNTTKSTTTIKPSSANSSTTSQSSNTKTTSVPTSVSGSTLDVNHGQNASVTIKTKPGVQGTIEVDYNSGPSTAAGLVLKTADANGIITWTWKVGTRTAPGVYPVIITVDGSTITDSLTVH